MRYSIFQKKISNYLLSVILVLNAGVLIIPLKSEPLEFDSILIRHIHEALQNTPNLKVLQNRIDAAVQHLPQAGAWTDPSVKFGLINLPVNSFDFNQEPMTGTWITITQQIPINGKSAIQSEIAELNL